LLARKHDQSRQFHLGYVVFAVIAIVVLQHLIGEARRIEDIPYSQFIGEYRTPHAGKTRFTTVRIDLPLADRVKNTGVEVVGATESTIMQDLLSWTIPMIVFFAVRFFLFRRFADRAAEGGLLSIGKSRAKVYVEKGTKVTFADVAGAAEAKEEVREIIEFLRNAKDYGRLGARIPKGILPWDRRARARR
jgi:cell division protease FtsH